VLDKDIIIITGAVAGTIAAILTTIERILNLRERFSSQSETDSEPEPEESTTPSDRWTFLHKLGPAPTYLVFNEILVIAAAGALLNYLGLLVGHRLESILFLDMVGTAFAAFLLGPWWGASLALITNSLVNWLLYPIPGSDLAVFPWSLVNMTGGFLWGLMGRSRQFRFYLQSGHSSIVSHIWFLLTFGVLAACVMSIPGMFVERAVPQSPRIELNPWLMTFLGIVIDQWQATLSVSLELMAGPTAADRIGVAFLEWLQTCIRYIPDKTVSVAIALIVLKRGFPLFEQELIHGTDTGSPPRDNRLAPLVLGLLYAPSFAILMFEHTFVSQRFWPLWTAPWLLITAGYILLRIYGEPDDAIRETRTDRANRYHAALAPIRSQPVFHFCQRLTVAILIAGTLFAMFMPVILANYSAVAFNFFCVVYGSLLALHLTRVIVSQNLSLVLSASGSAGSSGEEERGHGSARTIRLSKRRAAGR
jgi:uncharacterized integral membrane protein